MATMSIFLEVEFNLHPGTFIVRISLALVFDVVPVARMDAFRALKFSILESFRALNL